MVAWTRDGGRGQGVGGEAVGLEQRLLDPSSQLMGGTWEPNFVGPPRDASLGFPPPQDWGS